MDLDYVSNNRQILYNFINSDIDMSLEKILCDLNYEFENHESIMRYKSGIDKFNLEMNYNKQITGEMSKSFISKSSDKKFMIIICDDLLTGFLFNDHEIISNFICQLSDIKNDDVVDIIIDISAIDIDYPLIESTTFILNLMNQIKATKIFNFGSKVSFIDLMIATCCNEIYVGEFASLSLIKLFNKTRIPKFMMNTFMQFAKYTYQFWIKNGLLTAEEVFNFLSTDENHQDINLLSDEIKMRLKQ